MDNDDAFSFLSHIIGIITNARAGLGLTAAAQGWPARHSMDAWGVRFGI